MTPPASAFDGDVNILLRRARGMSSAHAHHSAAVNAINKFLFNDRRCLVFFFVYNYIRFYFVSYANLRWNKWVSDDNVRAVTTHRVCFRVLACYFRVFRYIFASFLFRIVPVRFVRHSDFDLTWPIVPHNRPERVVVTRHARVNFLPAVVDGDVRNAKSGECVQNCVTQ